MESISDALGTITLSKPSVADDFLNKKRSRLIQALLDNETGVRFESLALFAEPLFTLYEIDPGDAFQLYQDPKTVSDETLALLETARILWAFFSLSPDQRAHHRSTLAMQLIGESPTDNDWVNLEGLLESVKVHWKALLDEEIQEAETSEYPTLGFEELLQHDAFRIGEVGGQANMGFGPDALSETEARALFSQPLFESEEILIDADAFEHAVLRSDALWTLARRSNGDPQGMIASYVEEFASSESDQAMLQQEAQTMIERFKELFPEQA